MQFITNLLYHYVHMLHNTDHHYSHRQAWMALVHIKNTDQGHIKRGQLSKDCRSCNLVKKKRTAHIAVHIHGCCCNEDYAIWISTVNWSPGAHLNLSRASLSNMPILSNSLKITHFQHFPKVQSWNNALHRHVKANFCTSSNKKYKKCAKSRAPDHLTLANTAN